MAHFLARLSVVSLLGLTSCVSHQTTAIIQPQSGKMPLVTMAGQPLLVHKVALQGKATVIEGFWQINPDCSSRGVGTIRVTDQPAHGEAIVYQDKDFPRFPPGNPRAACDSRKLPATFLKYTPAPGYTGDDSLSIEAIDAEGTSRNVRFTITVE